MKKSRSFAIAQDDIRKTAHIPTKPGPAKIGQKRWRSPHALLSLRTRGKLRIMPTTQFITPDTRCTPPAPRKSTLPFPNAALARDEREPAKEFRHNAASRPPSYRETLRVRPAPRRDSAHARNLRYHSATQHSPDERITQPSCRAATPDCAAR